jgi:hypothetical protein
MDFWAAQKIAKQQQGMHCSMCSSASYQTKQQHMTAYKQQAVFHHYHVIIITTSSKQHGSSNALQCKHVIHNKTKTNMRDF